MNKKSFLLFSLLITGIFTFNTGAYNYTYGRAEDDSYFVSSEKEFDRINSVELGCAAELHLRIGNENKLLIRTDKKQLENIVTDYKNGNLNIFYKNDKKLWWDVLGIFSSKKHIKLYLTVTGLDKLTVKSSGDVTIETNIKSKDFYMSNLGSAAIKIQNIQAENIKINFLGSGTFYSGILNAEKQFDINSDGSAHLKIAGINTDRFDTVISGTSSIIINRITATEVHSVILGSGIMSLQGVTAKQFAKVDGSGRYYAGELATEDTTVKALGSSSVEVFANNSINVDIFGSTIVNVGGQPKINKCNVFGSGQVILSKQAQ